MEASEGKRRGRPRKQPKQTGHSRRQRHEPTRLRDESDSDGEGNAESRKAIKVGRDKAMAKEIVGAIANPKGRTKQDHRAGKVNIHARSQWVPDP